MSIKMAPIFQNKNGLNKKNSVRHEYKNTSEKYLYCDKYTPNQYCNMYNYRLKQMSNMIEAKIRQKWGNETPIKKLCDLTENVPTKSIIIGTLYKHQKYKPSILRDISIENQLAPQPIRLNYADESDKLFLEDELQRIRLSGKVDVQTIVTGVICAVIGYTDNEGLFLVDDFIFYESGPQKPLISWATSPLLVLISGLDVIQLNVPGGDYRKSLDKLQAWLSGNLPNHGNHNNWNVEHIVRVVIAGNSIRSQPDLKKRNLLTRMPQYPDTVEAVKYMDEWCAAWCKDTDLDVMPGENDPANFLLPQQPLHNCMFHAASKHDTFKSVTNPYSFEFGDRVVLGTSGQNVHDILKVSTLKHPIEVLKSTLRWSHVAPTCPDTLGCYPFLEKDPFIVHECPHIYFAGNCDEYKTEMFEGIENTKTRLICVPEFCQTQSVAVVDLSTLNCTELSFKVEPTKPAPK